MHILFPTDVFPPRSGGAGWSAHALALALQARGHTVTAVVPRAGATGVAQADVLGVPTVSYGYRAPPIPFLKNYWRHERLWGPFAALLMREAERDCATGGQVLIHAQHVQVTPAAVLAGRRLGAPVVVTVRDHWPWDYFATGLHADRLPYPRQTAASLATDFAVRLGPVRGQVALVALPYVLAHLRRRQAFLRQAQAVIAVSRYIAGRLEGIVAPERIHIIPNMVDTGAVDRALAVPPQSVAPGQPFLLFVGKLERNKGAHLLIEIFRAYARGGGVEELPPLLVAGDGPLRGELERELAGLGVRVRLLEWTEHDEVLRLMAACTALLFPSAWGEPLSRVPLEASACRAPVIAMPTGGTLDILDDGVNGAIERTCAGFAARLRALLQQPELRRHLGKAARARIEERFSTERVTERYEQLYLSLLAPRPPL